ncbi:hypothetical protein LDENG_00171470, partial [Lucifuga dentata]
DGDFDKSAEANELYDAVLTGSVNQEDKKVSSKSVLFPGKEPPANKESNKSAPKTLKGGNSLKKLSLYIGNFSWWTSDKDLICMAQTLGVKDITEIRFAENKANGQSRGYAEVVVSSEESLKTLLEKIPQCEIHGEKLDCRFASRHNLGVFEEVANKRIPMRVNSKDPKDADSEKIPSLLSQQPSSSTLPSHFPSHPLANTFVQLPSPFLSHPLPPFPGMPPNIPPPSPHHVFPPQPVPVAGPPPSSLHINPAFFTPVHDSHSNKSHSHQKHSSENADGDFEELMNRNRAVTSSAITKAVSGATTGDLRGAMETLLTAIAIIKQSRVYRDERCQALVTSLKDCLVSIQGNFGYRSRSRSRERERDLDRGRDRGRERDREDSYGQEENTETGIASMAGSLKTGLCFRTFYFCTNL